MGFEKKHGKGRTNDYWYKLSKEKHYRARSAFKLIQLNKKYKFLQNSKVLIDLCAAPGSWCEVASQSMPQNSLIIGIDLAPIKPIPRCITFQADITTDKCRATIRHHLKTLKADTVLHDGAPNVGQAWLQDAFSQSTLALEAFKLATDFLAPGGTFVTKVFRSRDYQNLLNSFGALFGKVEPLTLLASRKTSAEIFVVCSNYLAPKRFDRRFVDPNHVFEELPDAKPNNEAVVYNPHLKKRKREGYADGSMTQFKEVSVSDFIRTADPIAILGQINKLSFAKPQSEDLILVALDKMPETTQEIRECCSDLRVLGRKDFKLLLRWRLKVREELGFATKSKSNGDATEEVVDIQEMDEEMRIQEEMERLKDLSDAKKKKEKRKDNERKRKEIVRMQMNMTVPNEIGMDQGNIYGEEPIFALKNVQRAGITNNFVAGKMHTITPKVEEEAEEEDSESDEEEDGLEGQLDDMYQLYQERKKETDAKYRARKARTEHNDEFDGFSDREVSSDVDENVVSDDDSEFSFQEGEKVSQRLADQPKDGLSKRATMFFDQDIFKDIGGLDPPLAADSGVELGDSSEQETEKGKSLALRGRRSTSQAQGRSKVSLDQESDESSDGEFEVVKRRKADLEDWSADNADPVTKDGRPNIDIITAEAMTLAQSMATGLTTKSSLIDDAFNRYSHRDVDGLPDWFLDDENNHSRLQRPVTAAAAAAIREKLRALNARPIKKVREAQARKKMRAATRLERLKKKSALLVEDVEMSERDKASAIQKIMAKSAKKKPKLRAKLVVARGSNRGISGRPKGTKGKYKMVDARMKKETRALKRIAKMKK